MRRDVGIVIVAAGQGTRLGGVPKQFRVIAGEPMLFRTLRPYLDHAEVHTVVVVLPASVIAAPPPWLAGLAGPRVRLVAGGEERSDSVRAGLSALPHHCAVVLVHDGARPFPSPDVISAVIKEARRGVGAIAALPVTDTLKEAAPQADGSALVRRTVPRAGLWRAQTPQGFPRALLEKAHATAAAGTDDAQMVELVGGAVVLVPDSPLNLKVTTADDLMLAEAIAAAGTGPDRKPGGAVAFRTAADLEAALPAIREHLEAGKVLAYPTETVYGLGAFATAEGLARLSALKGRPAGKPFLLLISGREMAEAHGLVFSPSARALAEAFWPGPLTLVLAGGEGRLPDSLRGPEGGIAVRHTSHALMARLVAALGRPLTSTSANRPGQLPSPGPERILQLFAAEVASGELLVLDGGALGNVPPSTVIDCSGPDPLLIREGALPRAELRRAVGRLAP